LGDKGCLVGQSANHGDNPSHPWVDILSSLIPKPSFFHLTFKKLFGSNYALNLALAITEDKYQNENGGKNDGSSKK